MRCFLTFFSGLLLFFTACRVYGQKNGPWQVINFTKENYGAESQNWSVTQDKNGFIYAANNSGLLEFDGVEWSFYPSPGGTVIRSVAVDFNNRIYTSGYREIGYWERNGFGELEYSSLTGRAGPFFTPNEEFWNTVILDNRIVFHSFSSIFIYEGDSFQVVKADALIHSISKVEDRLCVHVSGKGLFWLQGNSLTPFLSDAPLNSDAVQFCRMMNDSTLLIGTTSYGLFLYSGQQLVPYLEEWSDYFYANKINRGLITSDGNLVIGTLLDGILVFDASGKLLHHFHVDNGLQNNTVLGLFSDLENNIWISLDKGLDYIPFLEDPSCTFFDYSDAGAVYAASLFEGDLYLCTNQGVFYRNWEDEGGEFSMIPGTQGQAWNSQVFDGQLLISHNEGTFRIEDHQVKRISSVSGGFSITRNPLREGQLVQSTYSNIVFYNKQGGMWDYAFQLPGFNDLIRYVELDHYNNLWASHMHRAVYRLKLSDSQDSILEMLYLGNPEFGKDFHIQVFNVENRIVFTTGERIYTYDGLNDSIIPYTLFNEGLGEYARAHRIVPAPDHRYWMIGPPGIGLFRIYNSELRKIREYPRELFQDHLISGYENILPLDTATALLCLDNGYALLRAATPDLSGRIEGRRLMLKSAEISGRTGAGELLSIEQNRYRLPFTKNSLALDFAFPLYSARPLTFQYYVEGLDDGWSQPVEKPEFSFTRMPSGEYTVRARAVNSWGRHSQEARINLVVLRPWYRSRLGIILELSILMGMLLLGRYVLLKRIRNRERMIAEQQEKELIRLRNEKLDTELAYKSQELANSTMAIIKKNEFLMELRETIKRQKEELGIRYPDKHYSSLVRKIDNNISSMDDWKVFEFHFEKAHEKFLQILRTRYPQLSHSDLRLCAYLRMNLTSKEIAPLLRISYRGVENHRYRLRKKLLLDKEVNLNDFMLSI